MLCIALGVMELSVMAVSIALPTIGSELDASTTQLQWITEVTVLVLASLLIAMGAVADKFGRRRILLWGLLVFLVASALSALTWTPEQLIAARALQGVGDAMIMPATLSLIRNVFPVGELGKAIAVWTGAASVGIVAGPLSGGFLVEHFGWRALFWVNVPLVAVSMVGIAAVVPASRGDRPLVIDRVSVLLAAGGMTAVTYAIIEAPHAGWTGMRTWGIVAGAGAALGCFLVRQRRIPQPLVDLRLVGRRSFWPATMAAATAWFALMGTLFLATLYFQDVQEHSPIGAAVREIPLAAGMLAMVPVTPWAITRIGLRWTTALGLVVIAGGMACVGSVAWSNEEWLVLTGLGTLAVGFVLCESAAGESMMASIPEEKAGQAAAVDETSLELGGSLGVAVLGSVLVSHFAGAVASGTSALPSGDAVATESVGGAMADARKLGETDGTEPVQVVREAFLDGFARSSLIAAAVMLVSALVVVFALRPPRREDPIGPPGQSPGSGSAPPCFDRRP